MSCTKFHVVRGNDPGIFITRSKDVYMDALRKAGFTQVSHEEVVKSVSGWRPCDDGCRCGLARMRRSSRGTTRQLRRGRSEGELGVFVVHVVCKMYRLFVNLSQPCFCSSLG